MHDALDMAQAEREEVRWLLMLALYHARPVGAAEGLLLRTIQDVPMHITGRVVRSELTYLAGQGLVEIKRERPQWYAELCPAGVDVVEYTTACPAGIGRPQKYW